MAVYREDSDHETTESSEEDDEAAYAHACASPEEVARGTCEECAYALSDNIDEKDWTIKRVRA